MMRLEVWRLMSGLDATIGLLFETRDSHESLCFTLEDQAQPGTKVPGETRIPAGTYRITLRPEGGFHQRYAQRFPDFHKGMLWIRDVPGFEYILLHCGVTDEDTAGCVLVGDGAMQNVTRRGRLLDSELAYRRIYPPIVRTLLLGGEVSIRFVDVDDPFLRAKTDPH